MSEINRKNWISGYFDYDYNADDYGGYTEKQQNKLKYPGQFEMICYQLSDNSSFLDSEGRFNWDDIHEIDTLYGFNLYESWEYMENHKLDFMTMETSFNLTKFELWILSDRCNPNHHCFREQGGLMDSGNILRKGSRFSTYQRSGEGIRD